ncbi:MAG: DUF6498-containing protein [Bacteroidota bacterium]
MDNKYIKQIGVLCSYLWLLLAYFLFGWDTFAIIFSYMIEVVMLVILYLILQTYDQVKNKSHYRNQRPTGNILPATVLFLAIQGMVIFFTMQTIDEAFNQTAPDYLLSKEVIFAAIAIFLFYGFDGLRMKNDRTRLSLFKNIFLTRILLLFAANLAGFLMVFGLSIHQIDFVIVIMVAVRVMIEIGLSGKE